MESRLLSQRRRSGTKSNSDSNSNSSISKKSSGGGGGPTSSSSTSSRRGEDDKGYCIDRVSRIGGSYNCRDFLTRYGYKYCSSPYIQLNCCAAHKLKC